MRCISFGIDKKADVFNLLIKSRTYKSERN